MNELMNEGLHFAALGGAEKVGMNMYAYMVCLLYTSDAAAD